MYTRGTGKICGNLHNITVGVALAAILSVVGFTYGTPVEATQVDDEFLACQKIEDRKKRYRCYDAFEQKEKIPASSARDQGKATAPEAASRPAPSAAPAVTPGKAAVDGGQVKRDFGLEEAKERAEPKSNKSIAVRVVSSSQGSSGRWVFRTEDGQVWRQKNSVPVDLPGRTFQAEIKKGALGSFFLAPEGKRKRIRVKRVK